MSEIKTKRSNSYYSKYSYTLKIRHSKYITSRQTVLCPRCFCDSYTIDSIKRKKMLMQVQKQTKSARISVQTDTSSDVLWSMCLPDHKITKIESHNALYIYIKNSKFVIFVRYLNFGIFHPKHI